MSFQNPVGGVPDPFGYRVEGAQEGSQQGGSPPEEPPNNQGVIGYLIGAMHKALDALVQKIGKGGPERKGSKQTLGSLKASLELLKGNDLSQDIHFLNALAHSWNKAIEESPAFDEEVLRLFNLFAKKILHYPETKQHTFGYYLTEYAGQRWIPFPYMELVQKIHREHAINPDGSDLTEWTRLLDDAIRLLP
ncbi:MAG: hypothetical protein KGQ49_05635 [Verrucomicrobia bacterium]|nr:hypothetical protein [Verrucomicrobiota bacterium]